MKNYKLVAEYTFRFNKILKEVDYDENFINKVKVKKFINNLTDKLVKLMQI